jgi:benzoylformate decarboxylase
MGVGMAGPGGPTVTQTVRDAALELLRRLGLRRCFGNPGSTEIPLLASFPEDLEYVLALHESAAVAMAAGQALATGQPALVSLHTAAGLGNGAAALANARGNRAPLVVLVGQQDRRHLLNEPFLTGRLAGLAGDYPLATMQPPRAQDVPSALAQAYWTAETGRGPVLVIVPMDDWDAPMDGTVLAAPAGLYRVAASEPDHLALGEVIALLDASRSPVLVAGAGADTAPTWAALRLLATRLNCVVWQEPFPSQSGFPEDDQRFAGTLPAARDKLRETLGGYDAVLVVGTAMLRQYHYEPGPFVAAGTRVVVLTEDPAEAVRSPCELALVTPLRATCEYLAEKVKRRIGVPTQMNLAARERGCMRRGRRGPLSPVDVFAALADRLPAESVVVEETPSSRELLQALLPARSNLGRLAAANGGLGFALPAAIGVRLACPGRPVVAVVGDGSALYCVQALWSAVHYRVGVLVVLMDNANYGVMNRLTRRRGTVPWPSFAEVRLETIAEGFGATATRIADRTALTTALDRLVPALTTATAPHVLVVEVAHESTEPGPPSAPARTC